MRIEIQRYYMPNEMLCYAVLIKLITCIILLVYDIIVHQLGMKDILLFLGAFSYCLMSGSFCLAILIYSVSIRNEHKTASIIVNNVSLNSFDLKTQRHVQIASLQMNHIGGEISCGIFKLNWKYMLSFIAGVFEFSLVLIQFDLKK